MTLTPAGVAFMDDHRCTAYCRQGQHAAVFWFNTNLSPVDYANTITDQFGFTVDHLEPAPEARLEGHIWGWTTEAPVDVPVRLIRDFPAFLVIFTTEDDDDADRRIVEAAAKAGFLDHDIQEDQ